VISNFLWNRYWTYPESRSKPIGRQMTQFFVLNLMGLGINLIVLASWTRVATPIVGSAWRCTARKSRL
jgi:putative flippase GtrA